MYKKPFLSIVEEKRSIGDKTEIKSNHKVSGFSIVTTSPYNFKRNEIMYRGEDALSKYLDELEKERDTNTRNTTEDEIMDFLTPSNKLASLIGFPIVSRLYTVFSVSHFEILY